MGVVDKRLLAYWLHCHAEDTAEPEPEPEQLWEPPATAVSGNSAPVVRLPMEDR